MWHFTYRNIFDLPKHCWYALWTLALITLGNISSVLLCTCYSTCPMSAPNLAHWTDFPVGSLKIR